MKREGNGTILWVFKTHIFKDNLKRVSYDWKFYDTF